jgi:peptidoglycan/LPS O-acetylase OafA/YrhL
MAKPLREVPPPLEGSDFVITAAVTLAWAIALVVVVLLRNDIHEPNHWWILTCATGFAMGLFGLAYVPHLKRARARASARRASRTADSETDG